MGAIPGEVDHPEKFRKRHGMPSKGQVTPKNDKEPETIMDLMQQLNRKSKSADM